MTCAIVTPLRLRPAMGRPCPFLARLSACLGILAAGCDPDLPGKPNPQERPVPADKVLAFDALYGRNCAGCHGKDGKLGPAPPLNDPLFLAIVPDAELHLVISAGRPGTPMPAFALKHGGTLTAAQVKVLAEGLKPRWGQPGRPTDGVPDYRLPETMPQPKGAGDAARATNKAGEKVFARACASCHGKNGQGIVRGEERRNKINEPAFLALISDQELRRIIITGRQDLHMPDYSQKNGRSDDFQPLTSTEIVELGALLTSWRQPPAVATK